MAVLLQYLFTGNSVAPTTTGSNVSGGNVTNGSLTNFGPGNDDFASDPVIMAGPSATSHDLAISGAQYWYFTLTANSGYVLNLTSLDFNVARGGSSTPRGWVVRSSVDSYAADISTAACATETPTWEAKSLDLSGSSYQGLSAITFRVYLYAPTSSNSVDVDALTVNGTAAVAGIPKHMDYHYRRLAA